MPGSPGCRWSLSLETALQSLRNARQEPAQPNSYTSPYHPSNSQMPLTVCFQP